MKKGIPLILAILALVFVTACQAEKANPESNNPKDYSGTYTDKQGTDEIYSSLTLALTPDGNYAVEAALYRLTTLTGTADSALHFTSEAPVVEGDITIDGEAAELTVTSSDFSYIAVGDVYRFPDGKEG